MVCAYFYISGALESQTNSESGEARDGACDPGLQGIMLIHHTTAASL